MDLLGVAGLGPSFLDDALDSSRVETAQVAGALGQGAAGSDGSGAALLERSVVEERVGPAVEDFVGEGRRLGGVAGVEGDVTVVDALEHLLQPADVHGFVEAVVEGLANQGVVGGNEGTVDVFLAADLLGENGGHQVVGAHALDVGRDLLAAAQAGDGQGRA